MADQINKTLVLGIELNTRELAADAAKLKQEINELKESQSRFAEGTVTYEQIGAKLRAAEVDYRNLRKQIDNTKTARVAETGSIKQMRAELAIATTAYNKLSQSERENTQAGKDLTLALYNQQEALKKAEGAIGDHRRNVGNYKNAIMDAAGQLNIFGTNVGSLKNSFDTAKNGVSMMSSSLGALKTAIISTGIGALIVLLGSLYTWFTKTEEGSEALERGQARLGQGFSILIGWINKGVQGIKALYEEYKPLIDGIIKVVTVLNPFIMGAKLLGDAFKGATDEAAKYTQMLQDVEDAERNNAAAVQMSKDKIDQLILSVKQKNLTDEQKMKNLDEASTIEKKLFNEELDRANKRAIAEKGLADIKRKSGEITGDNLGESESQALTKVAELKGQQLILDQKISNRRSLVQKELTADYKEAEETRTKLSEEENKKRLADQKAAADLALLQTDKNSADYLNKKAKVLEAEKQIELNNAELTKNQRDLINEKYIQLQKQAIIDYATWDEEQNAKSNEEKLNNDLNAIDRKRLLYALDLENKKISDETFKQLQIESLREEAELYAQGSNERLALELAAAQMERKIAADTATEKKKWDELDSKQKRAQASAQLGIAENTFGQMASMFEEGSAAYKTFATLQVAASVIQGIMNSYASTAALVPFGPILAPVSAGVAAAFGAVQIAKINSLSRGGAIYPKAEFGMMIGGNPHSSGGTKFVGSDGTRFEAEKNERLFVINKRSSAMIKSLSDWNVRGGGIDFYGGTRSHLADGGMVQRSMTSQIDANINSAMQIQRTIAALPPPIVVVQDINQAQGTLVKVKSRSIL